MGKGNRGRGTFTSEEMTAIGKRIRWIRSNMSNGDGLTQEAFGGLVGVTGEAVSGWESGRRLPSSENLRLIAKYGRKNAQWILTGIEFSQDMQIGIVEMLRVYKKLKVLPEETLSADEIALVFMMRKLGMQSAIDVFRCALDKYIEVHKEAMLTHDVDIKPDDHHYLLVASIVECGKYDHGFDWFAMLDELENKDE